MLNFSSVAISVISVLTGDTKSDAKSDNKTAGASFASMLDSNAANFSASDSDQSLVDTLYSKDEDDVLPPAAPMENTIRLHEDSKPFLSTKIKDTEPAARNDKDAPTKDAPAVKSDAPAAKKADKNDAKNDKDAVPVKQASNDTAKNDDADDDADLVGDKIRDKLNDLRDLLAMLTNLMNGGQQQVTSLTMVKISSTNDAASQVGFDSNGNPIDLSDRFNQLMAAIKASQNLPSDTKQSFTVTFASFQSIISPQQATDISALSTDSQAAFLAACTDCQDQLQSLSSTILTASAGDADAELDLQQMLAKMGDWMKDFRALVAQAKGQKAIDKAPQPQVQEASLALPVKDNTQNILPLKDVIPANPLLQAQALNTGATANNSVANSIATVASSGASNNASSGNNNSGGQGGERPMTAPISAPSAASANSTTQGAAPSFAKTLNAASQARTPVAEQVAFHIKTMAKDGSSKIQIQLDPVELGKLSIKLEVGHDGKTGVVVTADQKSTLDLLQRDARGLEQALADAGLKTDSGSLSFNLRGGDQQKNEQQQAMAGYAKMQPEEEEIAPLAALSRNYTVQVTDGLDIKI